MATLSKPRRARTTTEQVAFKVCVFANARCRCWEEDRKHPCDKLLGVSMQIVEVAKGELAEKYVLRRRPLKKPDPAEFNLP